MSFKYNKKLNIIYVFIISENTVAVIKKSDDKKEATITFTPDLEEQKRLARVFAVRVCNIKYNSKNYVFLK